MNANEPSIGILATVFVLLILASAYFSGSETGMMRLNRYRLKHLTRQHHAGARRASKLLETPDKLIGIILIGNNFVNFLAASIATSIAIMLVGDAAPVTTAIILTIIVLIFAEVTPKTIAALHPEKIAFPSSVILTVLLRILMPVVTLVNFFSNGLVRLLGFAHEEGDEHHNLSAEELRTIVDESGKHIPHRRQGMLLNILDLENVTVNDIMISRNDITAIDIEDPTPEILEQIANCHHTRVPIYKSDINEIIGILHMRSMAKLIRHESINKAIILQETTDPYFIPESTPLPVQLANFQARKERMAVVVDEFGAIKGIVTLEDILEEIVGEFTTDLADSSRDILAQDDGTFLIDASASIRDINRFLDWNLDDTGAKTLNGLLVELLQSIPDSAVGVDLDGYYAEIVQIKDNMIKTVRMWQPDAQGSLFDPASSPA